MSRFPRRVPQLSAAAPFAAAALAGLAASAAFATPAALAAPAADAAAVQRGLERLVAARDGPPGAIATLHRDGRTTVLRAGRANVERPG
ncbi:MAG TPA: hypothetical protein VLK58_16495, partial [Conexibacter sp.]|nr:hypothetical protein [Conexibacter sp.]